MAAVRCVRVCVVAAALLTLNAQVALGQATIAGVVKDATGAVLPGVTVEASSPVLIEKIRTALTDNEGVYRIVDLRPGGYSITFSLTGFNTIRREGIELSGTFTATVNADMVVGSLDETITVSGQSPVVDVKSVVHERVLTKTIIDALPTSRTFQTLAAAIPGITIAGGQRLAAQDVGGSMGDQSQRLSMHGSSINDQQNSIDGIPVNNMNNVSSTGTFLDIGSFQEISYELGAASTGSATGGVHVNFIPKDGGNRFNGSFFGAATNNSLQSDNVTEELRARGLGVGNELAKIFDLNGGMGGPVKRDKLWFFASGRYWGMKDLVAGMWYNKDPKGFVYIPDYERRAIDEQWLSSGSLRLTWQPTPKNKLNSYVLDQGRCICHNMVAATRAPEASRRARTITNRAAQVIWSSVITNRLLLEAGAMYYLQVFAFDPQPESWSDDILAVTELSTGLNIRATSLGKTGWSSPVTNSKATLNYVTGSHAVKVGYSFQHGYKDQLQTYNGDMNLQLLNGVPRSVIVYATPFNTVNDQNAALGFYGQDQWTIRRVTLNLGVRFDHHNSSVRAQSLPAARFVPAREYAAIRDVPNWTDLSPRLGASYDLFGTGKTALKVTLNRYVGGQTVELANSVNPVNSSVNSSTRTWTDRNGDFFPQDDELGPLSDSSFGQVVVRTRFDDAILEGFGRREYNWETSAAIQHELVPQMSVNASYHRRWFGNFTVTDNLEVTPRDFDPFCITAPVDARLPGGGGQQICGLYDVSPAKFGRSNSFVTFAENFGKQTQVYDGVDLTINARLHGTLMSGGLNAGHTVNTSCFVIDSPEAQRFCKVRPPFLTQVKFLGTVPLPRGFQASATFQSLPGPEITASYVVPNEVIRGPLGRDLAAGSRGTKTIALVEPGTMYEERLYQLDARMSKIFQIRGWRMQGNVDLYNLFNASPVLALNTRYGPAWLQPTYILPGRVLKFGAQVEF